MTNPATIHDLAWDDPPLWALAQAMRATLDGRWSLAAQLWSDQFYRGRYGEVAAFCTAEAALNSGQLDLATHALEHCGGKRPEPVAEVAQESSNTGGELPPMAPAYEAVRRFQAHHPMGSAVSEILNREFELVRA